MRILINIIAIILALFVAKTFTIPVETILDTTHAMPGNVPMCPPITTVTQTMPTITITGPTWIHNSFINPFMHLVPNSTLANLITSITVTQQVTTTAIYYSFITHPGLTTTVTATVTAMATPTSIATVNTCNAGLVIYLYTHLGYVLAIIGSTGAAIIGSFGIVFASPGT